MFKKQLGPNRNEQYGVYYKIINAYFQIVSTFQ